MKFDIKYILKCSLVLFISIGSWITSYSQISVVNTNVANTLAQKLVGPGVTISNATANCNANQAGIFTSVTLSNLGIDSGIVLTTGNASTIGLLTGVNGNQTSFANFNQGTLGDADLSLLSGTSTFDRCILEFDFKADGDSIEFEYVFGSEEYPAFNCSNYNDVFGFFISGPGYATPKNIALIPNSTIPVAINSVNNGVVSTGGSINNCNAMGVGSPFTSYYVSNTGGTSVTYDGFTALFTAKTAIQECQSYHLKLAIADGYDHIFDSGVFLKAGSLISNSVKLTVLTDSLNGGIPFLYEGCDSAIVKINRNLIQSVANSDTIQLLISGTATNGVDYPTISSTYIFSSNINDSVKTFVVKPQQDFITESIETIKFILVDRCGTFVDSAIIQVKDPPKFNITTNDTLICQGAAVPIQGTYDNDLTFSWQPSLGVTNSTQFNAILSPTTTTTYTLTASHNGCNPIIDSVKITVQPQPTLSAIGTNILCNGLGNGSIIATGTVSSNPISFTLFPGPVVLSSSPATFSNLLAGVYTVTVSSGLGCTKTSVVSISQPTPLVWTTTTSLNIACNSNNVGQINTIASGGFGSKTYTLMPGNVVNSTGLFTSLSSGNYTITAKDANNCSIFTVMNISQVASLNWVTTSATNITCAGLTNGSITTNALGGSGIITYTLNPGNITNTLGSFNSLTSDTYTVLASDATSCTASSVFNINQPSLITNTVSSTNLICNGAQSGTLQVSTSGGTPPLTFSLNPSSSSNSTGSFSNLSAGNYTITISDANGCTKTSTQSITQPTAVIFTNVAKVQPTCSQPNIGSITATATGGAAPLTFALNTSSFQSSSTFSNLSAGTYTIIAKDANGCTKTYLTILSVTNAPNLTNATLPIVCSMTTTDLNVIASGGTPTYNFTLNPGAVTNTTGAFGPATAGTYTVSVVDANGCTKSIVIVILPPLPLSWQSFITNQVPCNTTTGGGFQVAAANGTPIYSYQMVPPTITNTTGIFNNVSLGTYTITATDANNCTVSSVATMTASPPLTFNSPSINGVTCFGLNTGSATCTTSGGIGVKTYSITPGTTINTTGTFNNLGVGTYTIQVSDANNCSNSTVISISQPSALQFNSPVLTPPSCVPGGNGTIANSATGGTGPYTFKLNTGNFQSSGIFSGLNIGIYTIQVKDANNCSATSIVNLSNPNAMSFNNVTVNQAYCTGSAIGSIQASVFNANGTITYTVNPGNLTNNTGSFTNLPVNVYTVSASDAIGCTISSTASIIQPSVLSLLNSSVTHVSCNGLNNGQIQILVNGGIGTLNYILQPSNATNTLGAFSNLAGNNYTITATDAVGCTLTTSMSLINPAPLAWTSLSPSNVICNGTATGSISVSASGGTLPLTYNLTPSATSNLTGVFITLPSAIYTVNVTDANGCSINTTFNISQSTPFGITSISNTQPSCTIGNNGTISVVASGGVTPYQYQLNGGTSQGNNLFTSIGVSTYTISVTDAAGCTQTSSISITNPTAPNISNVISQQILCYGGSNGSIQTTASGGTGALSYNLMPGNLSNASGTFNSLLASSYTVSVTDGNGCSATSNVLISQPPLLIWDSVNNRDISCFGGSNGLVTSSASGGAGLITYTLMPNNISNNIGAFLGLSVGVYTLNATDTNGCQISAVFVINQAPPIVWTTVTMSTPTCLGLSNGSISANAIGGVGNFSYKLMPGNINNTTGTFSNLAIGPYTITAKDANSCTLTTIVNVQPPVPIQLANANTTFASCNPGCDGTVTLSASGGNNVYSYSMDGGVTFQNSNLFSSICTGVYTVIIKDGNNCTGTGTFSISTANGPNQLNAIVNLPSCNNSTNGSILMQAAGGTGSISYLMNPNNITNTNGSFLNLTTGLYSVTATDANGCSISTVVNLLQPLPLLLSIPSVSNTSCFNGSNGSISLTSTGGTGLVNYLIQPTFSQNTIGQFNGLAATNYTIQATDVNGCTTTTTANVSQPTQITTSIDSIVQVSCFGGNNGFVKVSSSGGTGNYTYVIQPNNISSTTGVFNNLTAGNYTVTTTDVNGCVGFFSLTITQPTSLQISQITSTNPSCIPGDDGTMQVVATGGTSPYNYSVNTGSYQGSSTFNNVGIGTYTITVQDVKGCTISSIHNVVNAANPLITSINASQASCNPGCDANLTVSAGSGTGLLQYSMDLLTYQASSNFANLCAANYTITVKDALGCTATSAFIVTTVSGPSIANVSGTNLLCNAAGSAGNGSIIISIAGGSGVVNFNLMPSNIQNTTGVFTNLAANTYSITGSDANGCTLATVVSISQPTNLTFGNVTSTPVLCNGNTNGTISAPVTGGTPPYSFSILPSGNFIGSATFNNLAGNVNYTITASDANGCTLSTTAFVSSPASLMVDSLTNSPVTCFGLSNGTLNAIASGGTGTLTYNLQPGNSSNLNGIFNNLSGNLYTLTVTDSNGCSTTAISTLFEPSQLQFTNVNALNISCSGLQNGSIQLAAIGGTGPLTYDLLPLNQPNSSGLFDSLASSTYTVNVSDANGCSLTSITQISEPSAVQFNLVSFQHVKCFNANNGSIQANAIGGTGSLQYTLQPGNITNITGQFNSLAVNTYTLNVQDANGCSVDTIININQPSLLSLTLDSTKNVTCFAGNDGLISTSAFGGTLPYLFTLQPGFNSLAGYYPNLAAGNYTMKVTDANGCIDSIAGIIINQPPPIIYTSVTHQNLTCYSDSSGSIQVTASGGTGSLIYSIQPLNMSIQSSPGNFVNLSGGTYTITTTDAQNCAVTTLVTIQSYLLLISTINIKEPICHGESNGVIQLAALGGSLPLVFSLNNAPFSSQNIFTNLASANYTISIQDAQGCKMDTVLLLPQPEPVGVNVYLEDTKCNTLDDGIIQASGTGGRFDYTYYLNPGLKINKSGFFSNLKVNNYTLTVKDSAGCSYDTTLTIRPPANPLRMAITKEDIGCYGIGIEAWAKANPVGGTAPFTYLWNTSDTSQLIENLPAGVYSVIVVDSNQCKVTDQITIDGGTCCTQLFAPTAFSPNGDGRNDNWRITTSTAIKIQQFEIYDRWGNRVWGTFDIKDAWDGNLRGKSMNVDTYFFILRYTCLSDGLFYMKKGDFTLVR